MPQTQGNINEKHTEKPIEKLIEKLLQYGECGKVEVIRRLIKDKYVRPRCQTCEELEPPTLAATQLGDLVVPSCRRESELLQQLPRHCHARYRRPRARATSRDADGISAELRPQLLGFAAVPGSIVDSELNLRVV